MIPELQGFALMFTTTHRLFHRALEGVSDGDAAQRVGQQNSMLWVAAHMVAVRQGFLKGLGGAVDLPWTSQFPRGGKFEDVRTWPALAEVRAGWDQVHEAFMARLETVTAEQLPAVNSNPSLDKTFLGTIGLAVLHDAYHVGQLGAMRRPFGLERLVG